MLQTSRDDCSYVLRKTSGSQEIQLKLSFPSTGMIVILVNNLVPGLWKIPGDETGCLRLDKKRTNFRRFRIKLKIM